MPVGGRTAQAPAPAENLEGSDDGLPSESESESSESELPPPTKSPGVPPTVNMAELEKPLDETLLPKIPSLEGSRTPREKFKELSTSTPVTPRPPATDPPLGTSTTASAPAPAAEVIADRAASSEPSTATVATPAYSEMTPAQRKAAREARMVAAVRALR